MIGINQKNQIAYINAQAKRGKFIGSRIRYCEKFDEYYLDSFVDTNETGEEKSPLKFSDA